MKNFSKRMSTALLALTMLLSFSAMADGEKEGNKKKENHVILAYDLDEAHIEIDYLLINDQNSGSNLTIDNVEPAVFDLSRNMKVNGKHISSGQYVVSLIEKSDGLAFNFHNKNKKTDDVQVQLISSPGTYSPWLNYSLEVTESDKISGEFNWKENTYSFEMQISMSNYVFAHIEKAQRERSAEWIDLYQAGIYAYVNDIDLSNSYDYAEMAYKKDQNKYTAELMVLYLTALGRDSEAAEYSNTVAIK
ncbi:MAG: hypothetical protein DRI54_02350 [Bacteroidetes bacterium]|nr:MAG: hypothetical protein DRI54_02350 [Bacteroidota bacterium]